jgi:hypothetical protein
MKGSKVQNLHNYIDIDDTESLRNVVPIVKTGETYGAALVCWMILLAAAIAYVTVSQIIR